jgi:hypothetical protein
MFSRLQVPCFFWTSSPPSSPPSPLHLLLTLLLSLHPTLPPYICVDCSAPPALLQTPHPCWTHLMPQPHILQCYMQRLVAVLKPNLEWVTPTSHLLCHCANFVMPLNMGGGDDIHISPSPFPFFPSFPSFPSFSSYLSNKVVFSDLSFSILNPSDIDNCYGIGFLPIIYLVLVHVGLNVSVIVSRIYTLIKY